MGGSLDEAENVGAGQIVLESRPGTHLNMKEERKMLKV